MLSGTAPRSKSGAKASGNCEDGPRAITGAYKAEKANHNRNPRQGLRTPNPPIAPIPGDCFAQELTPYVRRPGFCCRLRL